MDTANRNYREWFAAVRYGDKEREIVKVRCVKNFAPRSLVDFCPKTIYKIKTNTWNKNGEYVFYKGVMEGLGVTKDGARASRSATLKNMDQAVKDSVLFALSTVSSEPIVTTDVQSDGADLTDFVQERDDNRRIAMNVATNEMGRKLMHKVRDRLKYSDKRPSTNEGRKDSEAVKRPRTESSLEKHLKEMSKNRSSEKENADYDVGEEMKLSSTASSKHCSPLTQRQPANTVATSPSSVPSAQSSTGISSFINVSNPEKSTIQQSLESFFEKWECKNCVALKKELKEMRVELNTKLEAISASLAAILEAKVQVAQEQADDSESYLSFGKRVTGGKVHLGANYSCTDVAWRTMNTCKKIHEWCLAVLRGTFEERKAMLLRVSPRYADLDYFPHDYIEIIRGYYTLFVDRRIAELGKEMEDRPGDTSISVEHEFFNDNKIQIISQLGAQLSDRAESMYRQWRSRQMKMGIVLPERRKRTSTKQKSQDHSKRKAKAKLLSVPRAVPKLSEAVENGDHESSIIHDNALSKGPSTSGLTRPALTPCSDTSDID